MKITFVNLFDYLMTPLEDVDRSLPLGILSLAQVINNNKRHSAQVISMKPLYISGAMKVSESFKSNIENDAQFLIHSNPDIISMYTMCNTYHVALSLAKKIKSINPRIIVLFGGPQATIVAEETLKRYECVDGIGLGEGEANIIGILDAYSNNSFNNVNGLAYRIGSEIVIKNDENLVENLDTLPMLDLNSYNYEIQDSVGIDVGRGCPFSCIFCSTKSFWKRKFRIKSANRIYDEIAFYKSKYNVKKFKFEHDLFVANRVLVMDLCEKIKNSDLEIEWGCSARIDTVDEKLLEEMASAGCNHIFFGIESGSERMQKELKKNLRIDDVKSTISSIVKYGIKGIVSFIYGFPEETEEDIEATLNLIKYIYDNYLDEVRVGNIKLQLHKLMYLPKTEITIRHKDELVYVKNNRMEIFQSLDSWNDEELNNLVNDVDIFPNLFCVSTDLLERLRNLDIFILFINSVGELLYNISYNYILTEFGNSMLKLYYGFTQIISEKELLKCATERLTEKDNKFELEYEMLKKFIYDYKFTNINVDLLKDIFDFEYQRNELAFIKKYENTYWIKKYMYNVIAMVNSKKINDKIGNYFVNFKVKDGKFSVKYI